MGNLFDERLEMKPEVESSLIYNEHLVRYELAKDYVIGKTVLDVASGSGYGADLLAQAGATRVLAVDIDQAALVGAQRRYDRDNIEFIKDEAQELAKITTGSIDVVVSFETIEHLADSESFVRNIKRVLMADGLALISTPNREVFDQQNPFHIKEFSKKELIDLLKRYFKNVVILEQYNALTSIIKVPGGQARAMVEEATPAIYFLALASDGELILPQSGVASLNQAALLKWQNNLAWRAVNKLYSLLAKVGIIRK